MITSPVVSLQARAGSLFSHDEDSVGLDLEVGELVRGSADLSQPADRGAQDGIGKDDADFAR